MAAISPGFHLVASRLLEGRKNNLRDDYPAVLVGDPLLAVASGVAVALRSPAPPIFEIKTGRGRLIGAGLVCSFGFLQARAEYFSGRYSLAQTLSPTKIWHQAVVYPWFGYLAVSSVSSGLLDRRFSFQRLSAKGVILICLTSWAVMAVDAVRNPRLGHGELRPARKASKKSDPPNG